MKEELLVLLKRFLRGFASGFISSALVVGSFSGQSFDELGNWLIVLAIAGIAGGITGAFLALDKAIRWKE